MSQSAVGLWELFTQDLKQSQKVQFEAKPLDQGNVYSSKSLLDPRKIL